MKNFKKQCYTKLVKVATRQKLKIKKEVFVMNTKTMSQFEMMDTEMLAKVEGGFGG